MSDDLVKRLRRVSIIRTDLFSEAAAEIERQSEMLRHLGELAEARERELVDRCERLLKANIELRAERDDALARMGRLEAALRGVVAHHFGNSDEWRAAAAALADATGEPPG